MLAPKPAPQAQPELTREQKQALAVASARLRLKQKQAGAAPAAPQAASQAPLGGRTPLGGATGEFDLSKFEALPKVQPAAPLAPTRQSTNPNAPGYFDPLAPTPEAAAKNFEAMQRQNGLVPFKNPQTGETYWRPDPVAQVAAEHEAYKAREAAAAAQRDYEAYRAGRAPIVNAVSDTLTGGIAAADKVLMDAGQRFAYKLDPQGKVPQFISENVTPAAQKMLGGLGSKLPYGEVMGPVGEAVGGGLSEFAATTARNPVQGMTEATDMLEPTHYLASGANDLGEAGRQLMAGNPEAARAAYMEATPKILGGTVGVIPFGSATVSAGVRAAQAPQTAMRAAASRALNAADEVIPPGGVSGARTAAAAQPSPVPVAQPTVPQAPRGGAQPGATGAGQQAAGAVPPAGPATLQGVPAQPAISKQQALIDRDTIKITRRIMRSAGIKDADVMRYLPGAVQRFESLNDPRIPLAFFLKSDLPKHFPEEVANRVGTNLDVWGRARNAETGVNDTSRATINKTINELRKTQQSFLTDSAERNLFKGSLIGQEDQIVASLRETGRKGYEPVLDNARQAVDGRRVPTPDEAAAVEELRGILSDPMMLGYVDDATRIRAKKEGVDLDQLMQQDPIGAAHWLQSEFRRLSDAAEDAVTGKPTRMSQAYDDLREMVLDPLKRAAPGYEGAMNRYGHLYGAKDAVRFGKGIFTAGRSAYDTAQKVRQFKKLGRRQQTVAWKSIRDEFLNEFRGTAEDAAAKVTRMQQEGALDILEQLGPRGKRFADDIRSIAQVENPNLRAIDQGSGSPTYANQKGGANAVDMVQSPVNQAIGALGQKGSLPTTLAGDAVLAVSGLPPVLTLGKGITWTIDRFGNPSKKVLARATEGLYGLPKGNALTSPAKPKRVSGPKSPAAAALEAEEAEDMAELLRALDETEANPKTRGGRKGKAILNKIDAAAKAPANKLKAPPPPPSKKPPPGTTSSAAATVTGGVGGAFVGAALNPDDPEGGAAAGLLAGLGVGAGGGVLGNKLSKMGSGGKVAPKARVEVPKAANDGLPKGQMTPAEDLAMARAFTREPLTVDRAQDFIALLRGEQDLRQVMDILDIRLSPAIVNLPRGRAMIERTRDEVLKRSRAFLDATTPKAPVGAKPGKAPPPFKPVEGAEVIDTAAWTPAEFNAARKQLNEMMQDRRTMSGQQLADLDSEITSLRNALEMDGPPAQFADVPMASRFNQPVDIPWKKGSPESIAIEKAIADKRWTVQSVPRAKVIPTQDSVFFDYAKSAGRYAGDEKLPIVVKQGDQYFVADGHHRMMAQTGQDQIRARVIDLAPPKPTGGTKPPPAQAGFGGGKGPDRTKLSAFPMADEASIKQGPAFYSALSRAVEKSGTARAPAAQWKATLANAPGVKAEEIEWTGINDWLDMQSGPVTKQQVSEYLQSNGVKIEETVKGAPAGAEAEAVQRKLLPMIEEKDRIDRQMAPYFEAAGKRNLTPKENDEITALVAKKRELEDNIEVLQQMGKGDMPELKTKWSSYTLPGGENYRELLLKLPESRKASVPSVNRVRGGYHIDGTPTDELYASLDEAERAAQAIAKGYTVPDPSNNYKSSHWDEPNVLAHIRFKERMTPDGRKVLAIEEIQSDWHQAGRDKGYRNPKAEAEFDAYSKELAAKYDLNPQQNLAMYGSYKKMDPAEVARYEELQRAVNFNNGSSVPNAPFKNNAWASLSLKRMIRWAAEHGFDEIAWVPGKVPVERFSLEKQIDSLQVVDWPSAGDDMVVLAAYKGGKPVMQETIPRSKVKDYVGVEVADKVLAKPKEPITGARSLDGLDLRTGGEGMRAFYDNILVNEANKLGKKYGARVGQTRISTAGGKPTEYGDFEKWQAGKDNSSQVMHSLPITPALKKQALEGQALFAFPGGSGGVAAASAGGGAAYGYANPRDFDEDGQITDYDRGMTAGAYGMGALTFAGGMSTRNALKRGAKPPPVSSAFGAGGGKGPPKPSAVPGVTPPPRRAPPVGLASGAAGLVAGAAMPADDPQERALNAMLMASGAAAAGKAVQRGMSLPKRGDIVLSKPMAREIETTRRGLAANEVASIRGNAASPNPQSVMDAAGTPRAVAASMQRQGKGSALTERYNALGEPGKARAAAEVERTKKVRQIYQNQINAEIEARGGFDGWKRWLKESSEDFAALKRQSRSWPNTGNKPRNQQWPLNMTNKERRQRQLDRMGRIAEESVPTLPDISDVLRENNRQRKVIRDVLKTVPEARTLSDADLDTLVTLYMDKKAAEITSRILDGDYRVQPGSEEYWMIAGMAALGAGFTAAAGYNSLEGQAREQSPR